MPYTTEEIYNKFKELGGSHNLREDCGTLARGFEKFESLNADDAMSPHVESMMQECRRELDTLRSQLGQETYQ
ncbi:7793_t:CDS:2 [Entrophospora sp. SA101]|nr:1068_t:CDS:2 [Entrophospora sp. SA101]CAJ0895210.1 7793_t:CDS:2 [Entrophospora sp. SA101]